MKIFTPLLLLFLFSTQAAIACSPPHPNYKFRTIADKVEGSEHIIMGKRHLSGLRKVAGIGPIYDFDTGEPSTARIQVVHVLKGDIKEDIITVRTSFGMCGFAFLFGDDQTHIMLLSGTKGHDGIYQPNGSYNDSPDIALRKNAESGVYEAQDDTAAGYTALEDFIKKYQLRPLPTEQ